MKRLAAVFAMLAIVAAPAAAQRGMHGGMKWLDEGTITAAKELATSLSVWARTSVLPEAQAWKNQLDRSLSAADLSKLNDLRRQAAELHERHVTLAKGMASAWKSEDYDALKTTRAEMKTLARQRKAILEQLKPIAEANRATLQAIAEQAMPKLKEWSDEARAIGEQWWEQNKTALNPQVATAIGRLMHRKHDLFMMLEPKLRSKAAAARFMLWNGEDFTQHLEQMIDNAGAGDLNLE